MNAMLMRLLPPLIFVGGVETVVDVLVSGGGGGSDDCGCVVEGGGGGGPGGGFKVDLGVIISSAELRYWFMAALILS
jgi:hypothetical protein